jgi:hypothetical protein
MRYAIALTSKISYDRIRQPQSGFHDICDISAIPLALRHAHHFMPTTLRIYLIAYIGLLKKEMHMGGAFTFTDDMTNVMLTYTELRLYELICMYIAAQAAHLQPMIYN